jgi:hypothetical protein
MKKKKEKIVTFSERAYKGIIEQIFNLICNKQNVQTNKLQNKHSASQTKNNKKNNQ